MAVVQGPTPASGQLGQIVARRKRLVRRLRFFAVGVAVLGFFYLASRYELLELPEDRCSPVSALQPGSYLLLDRDPPQLFTGDAVFFETPAGELALGKLVEPPGTPAGTTRVEDGYWIVGDALDCSTPDSTTLGPIAPDSVQARVLFSLDS